MSWVLGKHNSVFVRNTTRWKGRKKMKGVQKKGESRHVSTSSAAWPFSRAIHPSHSSHPPFSKSPRHLTAGHRQGCEPKAPGTGAGA